MSMIKNRKLKNEANKRFKPKSRKFSDLEQRLITATRDIERFKKTNAILTKEINDYETAFARLHTNAWHAVNMIRGNLLKASPKRLLNLFIQKIYIEKKTGIDIHVNLVNKVTT